MKNALRRGKTKKMISDMKFVLEQNLKDSILLINKKDNVVTALKQKKKGDRIRFADKVIEIKEEIPIGHKIAISEIRRNEPVVKYGETIGVAVEDIMPGEWVHIHNLESTRARGDKK